jgi:hypothetical protein
VAAPARGTHELLRLVALLSGKILVSLESTVSLSRAEDAATGAEAGTGAEIEEGTGARTGAGAEIEAGAEKEAGAGAWPTCRACAILVLFNTTSYKADHESFKAPNFIFRVKHCAAD